MRALLLILVACSSPPARRAPVERRACDPFMEERPAPEPAGQAPMVCGNGVIDTHAGPCTERCTRGCDGTSTCHVDCAGASEACDGAALAPGTTCTSAGYAGGSVRCAADCVLDYRECVACVAGPDVKCGRWDAPIARSEVPDEAFVVASPRGDAAAVFVREAATGRFRGATVSPALAVKPLAVAAGETLVAYVVNDGLGFVDKQRRFGTIDHRGRVRMAGPIAAAASSTLLIYRETDRPSGALVFSTGMPQTLSVFGAGDLPRHFHVSNYRIVIGPGSTVQIPEMSSVRTYTLGSDGVLTPAEAVDTGATFSFVYPVFTDTVGGRVLTRRTAADLEGLPAGVGKLAVAGASSAPAFGGTLHARIDDGRVTLTWTRR